jgi:hypothetical protein
MATSRTLWAILPIAAAALVACGSDDSGAGGGEDAAPPHDSGRDVATGGGEDAGQDATVGGEDASEDAAPSDDGGDATVTDATVIDASDASDATVPVEASVDAGVDSTVPAEAGEDAGQDASDASEDAGIDAADSAPPVVVTFVPGVMVSTLAGSETAGERDGVGDAALFDNPTGIAIDHHGDLIVVDYDGWTVRLVTPAGAVATIGRASDFVHPYAAGVGLDGRYFVSTDDDPVDGGSKTGTSGAVWSVDTTDGGLVAPHAIAMALARPRGITAASDGGLVVSSRYDDLVEHLDTTTGALALIAGSGDAGFAEGTGAGAYFSSPLGVAHLPGGSYAVADVVNARIRLVTSAGVVTTLAGDGTPGMIDGPCATARFGIPHALAADAAGNVYVSDGGNQRLRRIDVSSGCVVETLAGDGTAGYADGAGDAAEFFGAEGIDVTADGKTLYVADGDNGSASGFHRIRAVTIP